MFDKLVESTKQQKDSGRSSKFLGVTTVLYSILILGVFAWSLWSMLPSIDDQDLELTTLVAPPPAPQVEPPKPEEPKEKPQQTTQVEDRTLPTRTELVTATDDVRVVPKEISSVGKNVPPIPKTGMVPLQGKENIDPSGGQVGPVEQRGGSTAPPRPAPTPKPDDDDPPPPPTPKPPPPTPKPTATPAPKPSGPISGGVVNGKARNLVKPGYPPAAKAVRASGAVNVQVLIDESGRVVSASAVSGHPLLRAAAEQAARASSFSPTLLSGQAVKVSGTIVYNFVPQ